MDKNYWKIVEAAQAGGKVLKKYFGKKQKISEKTTHADLQTEADLASEKIILKILSRNFSSYNIHSEENGRIDKKSEFTFIVDPLDGSHNFSLNIPNFTVSIALFKNANPIFAVVDNPILGETFYSQKNKGAYIGNKRVHTGKESNFQKSSIAYTCNYLTPPKESVKFISALYKSKPKRFMMNWSPAMDLCLLAYGKIDGFICNGGEIYDFAAGKLIAQEAQAQITDFKGKKENDFRNTFFIASSNLKLQKTLLNLVKEVFKKR